MTILAIDPGTTQSGYVVIKDGNPKPVESGVIPNGQLLNMVSEIEPEIVLCEWIESYGMSVGKSVFETCHFIGRLYLTAIYYQVHDFHHIGRKAIKMHHCNSMRAKDANIRQTLIDKYGKPGTKKAQGATYGIKSHAWSAYALAMYYVETGGKIEVTYEPNF